MSLFTKIKEKKYIKTVTVVMIFLILGAGGYFGYAEFQKWIKQKQVDAYNSGVVTIVNQIYKTANEKSEVPIRNFIIDDKGKLIKENGQPKQGDLMILTKKEATEALEEVKQ